MVRQSRFEYNRGGQGGHGGAIGLETVWEPLLQMWSVPSGPAVVNVLATDSCDPQRRDELFQSWCREACRLPGCEGSQHKRTNDKRENSPGLLGSKTMASSRLYRGDLLIDETTEPPEQGRVPQGL